MELNDFSRLTITDVQFLPIVKEYARRINLVDTINHMVNTEMELQPGPVVLGMVLDTLSGRSPLYRLKAPCVRIVVTFSDRSRGWQCISKTLNNELLTTIFRHMANHGLKENAFVYVADSAFVTQDKGIRHNSSAGCFVLITNLIAQESEWNARDLLKLYKNQSGIEQNFGFLKNPVIINSVFLKKNSRIEVLGMILLISLLIWRLMERAMRQYVEENKTTMTGWVKRRTKRPTSFMMTTKFHTLLVIKSGAQRQFAKPLKPVQLEYLKALDIEPEVFITP